MIQLARPSFLNCFTHRCIRDIPNYHETINLANTLSHLYVNEARIHRHGTRAHTHIHTRIRTHIVVCFTTIVTIHAHRTLPSRTRKRLDSRFCITFFIGRIMQSNGIPIHGHRVALFELFRLATHFLFPPFAHSILVTLFFFFFFCLFFFWPDESDMCAHEYARTVFWKWIDEKFERFD